METQFLTALTISHGLSYILLSDFPFDELDDPELSDLCERASALLKKIVDKLNNAQNGEERELTLEEEIEQKKREQENGSC